MRISRSFTVAPGNYDVFVRREGNRRRKKRRRMRRRRKLGLIKQAVTVPNLWNDELNTSSVIVAERIDPLPAPLTPQQQGERPYALGTMEIVPATSTKFTKKAELSTFLLIYNTKIDAANKPDVTVEYNFYAKQGGSEKFFNKTNPQNAERADAADGVGFGCRPPAPERTGRPAGVVPGRRLSARNQGDRQDRQQDADPRRELLRLGFVVRQSGISPRSFNMARAARLVASATVGSSDRFSAHRCSLRRKPSAAAAVRRFGRRQRRAGAILGTVKDDHGQPIANVVVSALGATTTIAVTDKDGRFEFGPLRAGPYLLRAHLAGYVAPARGRRFRSTRARKRRQRSR